MKKTTLMATLALLNVCVLAEQRPPERSGDVAMDIPADPTVRTQLLHTAASFATVKTNYQDWVRTEQEIKKLMDAAGQDRERILRNFLAAICDYKPGQDTRRLDLGFKNLEAYFFFTKKEISEVVAPYAQTTDPVLQQVIGLMVANAESARLARYRRDFMAGIEKLKASGTVAPQKE